MEQSRPLIPLRPLTFGELLDTAVLLLRSHARLLLSVSLVLALCEQAALYPLRALQPDSGGRLFRPADVGLWWLTLCSGLATEGAVLVLLGGLTGLAAVPALLNRRAGWRTLLRQWAGRLHVLVFLAVLVGLILWVSSLAAMLPWCFFFGAVGLAGPALLVDRIGPFAALGRSLRLTTVGLRAVGIRLGSYVSWAAIRLALGYGANALLDSVLPSSSLPDQITTTALWVLANTVIYAALSCLDAVLYLETRMRVEGLDIAVGRIRRAGRPVDVARSALLGAVPR